MANNQLAQQQMPPLKTPQRPQGSPKQRPTTPESPQLREARSERQRKNRAPNRRVNPVMFLLQKHPLLVWSTLWVGIIMAGGFAIIGLTSPGHVEKESSLPETTTTQNTVLQEQNDGNTPAWVYGAIALACTAGSWVIIKQLKGSKRRRLLRKPLKQRPTSEPSVSPQKQKAATASRQQALNPRKSRNPPAPKQPIPKSQVELAIGQTQFLSPDHPVSQLAISMDLRKRQPLSSLLRNE